MNHKVYDPNNENQRESFFYSMLVLFVPFRDESSLLKENETCEEAYHRLLSNNEQCSS